MISLIKYVSVSILMLSFIGCQEDSSQEAPPQQGQQQQPLQDQMQQPPTDVELSEGELEVFANAIFAAQEVQMEAQQEMVGVIENEGIDVETYSQIAQATQMGQSTDQLDVSDEDIEKFESVSEDLTKIQSEAEQEMSSAIEDEGMKMDRFQQINLAIQQDPKLQKKIQQKMQETQTQ